MSREFCRVLKMGKEISIIGEEFYIGSWKPESLVLLLIDVGFMAPEAVSLEELECPEVNSIVSWHGGVWVIKAIRET